MTQAPRGRLGLHRAYVAIVFVLGLAALVDAVHTIQISRVPYQWVLLSVLTLASGVFTIKVPALNAALSISETFLFITVLMFGGAPAVATVALDGLTISLIRRRREYRHALFNFAEPTLSMWVAWKVYAALSGVGPLVTGSASIAQIGLPALALSAVYFLMNSGLNALAVSSESGASPFPLWRKYFLGVSLNYFGGASIAVLLVVNMRAGDVVSSVLAIAPLVIVSYVTFKSSMGRLEDENRHLNDRNRFYLQVVEAFAATVEGNDDVTHGHIRRVQKYALRLASAFGVVDPLDLKAIEDAAVLHDIGKVAIPEHILNKPGRLTADEFELMKTHAARGAEILSAVEFPYPVVPIVRHHHENWDGTGYPAGLAGEAIPIGARVLSVVDCYDALRSHRPYRRALSPDQAIAIVRERRGSMYDPAVVDAFETIQSTIESEAVVEPLPAVVERPPHQSRELSRADDAGSNALPLELRLSATDMLLRLYDHLSRLGPDAGVDATCDVVSRYLLRLAPASLVVFYRRDEAADEVVAAYASGFCEALVRDARMPLGHGVSGWVAANGRSVINADAALDLGHRVDGIEPPFRSILSIPLRQSRGTIGAVTLYASQAGAFREEQRQALELVSGAMADAFARALQSVRSPAEAALANGDAGMSGSRALKALLTEDRRPIGDFGRPLGVICIRNDGDPAVMTHATMAISQATRIADLIFRPSPDSVVVLMPDSDAAAGELVLERMAAALPPHIAPPSSESSPLRIGFACSPNDGDSVRRLLEVAQDRLGAARAAHPDWRRAAPPVVAVRKQGGQPCQA